MKCAAPVRSFARLVVEMHASARAGILELGEGGDWSSCAWLGCLIGRVPGGLGTFVARIETGYGAMGR